MFVMVVLESPSLGWPFLPSHRPHATGKASGFSGPLEYVDGTASCCPAWTRWS